MTDDMKIQKIYPCLPYSQTEDLSVNSGEVEVGNLFYLCDLSNCRASFIGIFKVRFRNKVKAGPLCKHRQPCIIISQELLSIDNSGSIVVMAVIVAYDICQISISYIQTLITLQAYHAIMTIPITI